MHLASLTRKLSTIRRTTDLSAIVDRYLVDGSTQEAISFLELASKTDRLRVNALALLCEIYLQLREFAQAEKTLGSFRDDDKKSFLYLESQVKILIVQGHASLALKVCHQAFRDLPPTPEKLLLLGYTSLAAGDIDLAKETLSTGLSLFSENCQVLCLSSRISLHEKKFKDAQVASLRAISQNPSFAMAHYLHGIASQTLGQHEVAISSLEQTIVLKPSLKEAAIALGQSKTKVKDYHRAILAYTKASQLFTCTAGDHLRLAEGYNYLGQFEEAESHYHSALRLNPDSASVLTSYGISLQVQGRVDEAIGAYFSAVLAEPGHAAAHLNLGLALLLLGDYHSGWREYRWRHIALPAPSGVKNTLPIIESKADISEHVLLSHEQGAGDFFHFIRYAQILKRMGASVYILCPVELIGIAQSTGWFEDISEYEHNLTYPRESCRHIPMLSLPEALSATRDNPILTKPYLFAPCGRRGRWEAILNNKECTPLIGINWQGNPNAELTTLMGRSMPLKEFMPLLEEFKNVRWLSLQKGAGSEQLEDPSIGSYFVPCQPTVSDAWDFLDCSAIIDICDLIITTDTGVAHLAGAMGKPVWLLLNLVPEWRWGLEGDSSPWYPSMRLFRQKSFGNWPEVIETVQASLRTWLNDYASLRSFTSLEKEE